MPKNPVYVLSFILALAVGPSFINILSGAYVKKILTQNINLAAAPPAETAAEAAAFPLPPDRNPARKLTLKSSAAAIADFSKPPLPPPNLRHRESAAKNLSAESGEAADGAFVYKINQPPAYSAAVIILLHGSGGDETALMPFARAIWPRATLIGIRGRIIQGGERRWYHKFSPVAFNQREALREADELAAFIAALARKNHYAADKIIFVGYSNGANILTVMAMKYPSLVRRAVALRPMPILSAMPQGDLRRLHILTLSGQKDRLYGAFAEPLYAHLRQNGAQVVSYRLPATHKLGREDEKIISRWLRLGY